MDLLHALAADTEEEGGEKILSSFLPPFQPGKSGKAKKNVRSSPFSHKQDRRGKKKNPERVARAAPAWMEEEAYHSTITMEEEEEEEEAIKFSFVRSHA